MKNHIPIFPLKWFLQFLFISIISFIISVCTGCKKKSQIDRFSLVNRHNIEIAEIDSLNSLSIGNGEFVFTTDITGLQTFPEYYSKGISLGTMSNWGWDFPMLAMSAASVGRSEQAIDFLMMDVSKNRYLTNGHNYQDARLAIYLPGNGGLLTAVAKICVQRQFPDNGKWNVKYENLNRYVE